MFNLSRRNIRVAVSPFCNFHCIYCDDGQRSRKPGRPGAMEDFRREPLNRGVINTITFIEIIKALRLSGFEGMTLTGGEPFLNPEWDVIVNESRKKGMSRIGITTNGMLLNTYIQKNKHPPEGLTLLTISLDTVDPDRFAKITGIDRLEDIIKGLKAAKKDNPKLTIRANKVVLRSDMESLLEYMEFCEQIGAIDEINLLNLILKEKGDKFFFEKEFISASEILDFFSEHTKYRFSIDKKYEFIAKLPGGLKIIVKETNLTLRSSQCDNCPIYCQEGFYTIRVATDGTINTCLDYKAELPFVDGPAEIERGNLQIAVNKLVDDFKSVELEKTLTKFFRKYDIKSRK